MTDQATDNLLWADALIDGITTAGVRQVVISPGSRSTPLVMACERNPQLQITTLVDERCAAFFALGMAKQTGLPVAVIATSGSAPAHWYPAVIEASHSGIPLLLMSADRPPELQDCGSNQTTNQKQMFGVHVRAFFDPGPPESGPEAQQRVCDLGIEATHQAMGQNPGPVHLNLPFREPLVPETMPEPRNSTREISAPRIHLAVDEEQIERILGIISSGSGVIICGPGCPEQGFPAAVTELARRLGVPLMADPLSGLRFGNHGRSNIICRYDSFLRSSSFVQNHQPEWAVRFGSAPVSKSLLQFLEQSRPDTILCAPRGDWPDPLHQTREMVRSDPTELCNLLMQRPLPTGNDTWLKEFQHRDDILEATPENSDPLEKNIIEQLVNLIPGGSTLFSSNSLSVRMLDSWSGADAKPVRILANRGVSGIDGNISTLLGIASMSEGAVLGLLGDLACYHDMNGLLAARGVDATIIVFNNGGGAIFGYLPQHHLEQFDQHWLTPTSLDLSKMAQLYGLNHHPVTESGEFSATLTRAMQEQGVTIIEVMIDREKSLASNRTWLDRALKLCH